MKQLKLLILIGIFALTFSILKAQSPPHPNGGSAPGSGSTPVGGGAPNGGGLIILLTLGLGYSTKKIFDMRKETSE